jgi:hypothetical protein
MAGSFEPDGSIDPAKGRIVICLGKKGSGKSVMGLLIACSFPYDMVVIDTAKDDGPLPDRHGRAGTHTVHTLTGSLDELPDRWPEHLRYDSNEPKPENDDDPDLRLVHCEALPKDVVAQVLRWAKGQTTLQPPANPRQTR